MNLLTAEIYKKDDKDVLKVGTFPGSRKGELERFASTDDTVSKWKQRGVIRGSVAYDTLYRVLERDDQGDKSKRHLALGSLDIFLDDNGFTRRGQKLHYNHIRDMYTL
jgi:hypothetical protein